MDFVCLSVRESTWYNISIVREREIFIMYEMKKEYFTGITLIDDEHRQLFDYANQIYNLLKAEFVPDKYDNILDLLGKLRGYAKKHFADEEAYMESINYKKLFTQKIQHKAFEEELEKYNLDSLEDIENQDVVIR